MEEQHDTRPEMLSTHREAISQVKEAVLNQPAAVGRKSDNLYLKRTVAEDVFLRVLPLLKEMYANEIALLGYKFSSLTEDEEWRNRAILMNAIFSVPFTGQADQSESCKSGLQKRVQQEEAERVQRVTKELNCIMKDTYYHNERLRKRIEPFGLTVKEIKCDEHSLFRAVEDQLKLHSRGSSHYGYQELRGLTAAYMREHASDFLGFFPTDEIAKTDIPRSEKFKMYCKKLESAAEPGGFQELRALAHCIKRHTILFSGDFPTTEWGKEYESGEATIFVSKHSHNFRLRGHYNSLVPRFQK